MMRMQPHQEFQNSIQSADPVPSAALPIAIELSDASVTFGRGDRAVPALSSTTLRIADGEFVALVGPSGCGKSTLLNIVAGLDRASDGTIEIGGRIVNDVPPKDRDIAMVFQSYALYPSMTVRQNITFGMECRHVPKAEQEKALANVAKLLQIEPLLGRKPSQLSGGQRQRVAMGRALVRDPLLFLFDEPLSNLDAKLRVEMRMEIKRLHQRIGATIVYVTPDQIEAMTMATRIAVMHRGVVQQFADPDTVYRYPANLFVARFMGSPPMNTMPARLEADAGGPVVVIGAGRPDEVRLHLQGYDAATSYVGREVVLGIRPECIAEGDRVFSGAAGAPVIVTAPVELVEPTGAETIVLLRLGGEPAQARISPDIRPTPGATASFALDTRRICLFDPETERLIA
jgi:multiple sugar transport system ATP-binding protein